MLRLAGTNDDNNDDDAHTLFGSIGTRHTSQPATDVTLSASKGSAKSSGMTEQSSSDGGPGGSEQPKHAPLAQTQGQHSFTNSVRRLSMCPLHVPMPPVYMEVCCPVCTAPAFNTGSLAAGCNGVMTNQISRYIVPYFSC